MKRKGFVSFLVALIFSLSFWSVVYGRFVLLNDLDRWIKVILLNSDRYFIRPVQDKKDDQHLVEHQQAVTNNNNKASSQTTNKKRKPLFVLHVGPSKTGTSTIEWFAQIHEELLQRDNIYYAGHFKNENAITDETKNLHVLSKLCYGCQNTYDTPQEEACMADCTRKWSEFEQTIQHHYELGHDVFVSNEMFSGFRPERFEEKPLWNHLHRVLNQNWDVRVVFVYRRYYEWVPSKYFQLFDPRAMKKGKYWPSSGGRETPAFSDYYESHQRDDFKHPMLLYKKWKRRFGKVLVFNMHDTNKKSDSSFLASFFCKMLPEATHACSYLRASKNESSLKQINVSTKKMLHFDMLAVHAHKRGWIHNDYSRTDVWMAAQGFAQDQTKLTDYPLTCLSNIQRKQFLNQSLEMERDLLPKFHDSPQGKAELERGFAKAMHDGKFCSIDTDKVLEQEKWKRFFQSRFSETVQGKP